MARLSSLHLTKAAAVLQIHSDRPDGFPADATLTNQGGSTTHFPLSFAFSRASFRTSSDTRTSLLSFKMMDS